MEEAVSDSREAPDESQEMRRFMGWERSPCGKFFWLSVYCGLPLRDTAGGWDGWKGRGGGENAVFS